MGNRYLNLQGSLFLVCAFATFSLSMPAYSHGDHGHEAPKKAKRKPKTSNLKLTIGASATKGLGNDDGDASSTGNGSSTPTSGHQHLNLHGDEDHGSSGGSGSTGSGTAAPAFDPILNARLDYAFSKRLGFGLLLGYGFETGFQDPEAGPTSTFLINKNATYNSALTASYPASKESVKNYKITSIKLITGPTYTSGAISFGVAASVAYAWYSKTVIIDESAESKALNIRKSRAKAQLHGEEEEEESGGEEEPGAEGPSGDNLASADREFSRYGGRLTFGYQISKLWRADSSLGASMINHQFGPSTWATDATLAQLSFSYSDFMTYLAVSLFKEAPQIAAPSTPSGTIGLSYTFK